MKNQKSTKKALLSSVLSLVICLTMLIGTTFAWFTDSVTSGNNIIKSGNLDIELEYWNGERWKDVKEASDILTNELWEPGVTEVAYLRVANAGSLVLKYQLGINILNEIEGKNQAGETFKLSDYIMFGVVEGVNGETDAYAKNDAGRASAIAAVTESKKLSAGYTKASTMDPSDELYLALVVYMPTSVGNVANHNGIDVPQIDLGINVYATQKDAESDSFGSDYDKDSSAFVSSAEELRNAIATVKDGGTVYVNDGIYNIDSQLTISGKSINIVGVGENAVIHMTDKRTNYNKIFYIYGSSTEGEDITVNISNVTLTADIATKSDIWVRTDSQNGAKVSGNVTVNLNNVTCTSIICDNNYVDGDTVNLNIVDSTVKKVTLDASPFNNNGLNTYTNFTYNASRIDSINVQSGVNDLSHITINGVNPTEHGEQQTLTYVDTVEEFQTALDNVVDGDVLVLAPDITATVDSGALASKELTFTGDKSSTVVFVNTNPGYEGALAYHDNANLTFQGITFDASQISGICARGGEVTFIDCYITGELEKTIASKFEFTRCTFDVGVTQVGYGCSDVVFDGCNFESDGYGIKIYSEGNTPVNLIVKNSSFKNTGSSAKSAILLDHIMDGIKYNITVDNCTFEGFTATPTPNENKWAARMIVTDSFVKTTEGQYIFSYQTGTEGGPYHKLLTADQLIVTVK